MLFHKLKYAFRLVAFTVAFISMLSCNDSDDSPCQDAVCTLDFRVMTLTLTYDSGEPVPLDDFKVIITETGRDITGSYSTEELEWFRSKGTYPVIDDSFSDEFRNTTVFLSFLGFINNEQVVQNIIMAGADCCHVYLKDNNIITTIRQ